MKLYMARKIGTQLQLAWCHHDAYLCDTCTYSSKRTPLESPNRMDLASAAACDVSLNFHVSINHGIALSGRLYLPVWTINRTTFDTLCNTICQIFNAFFWVLVELHQVLYCLDDGLAVSAGGDDACKYRLHVQYPLYTVLTRPPFRFSICSLCCM